MTRHYKGAPETPDARALRARIAVNERWAKPGARARARAIAQAQWERQVDPDGTMDPAERARCAQNKAAAHAARMRLARQQKRDAART